MNVHVVKLKQHLAEEAKVKSSNFHGQLFDTVRVKSQMFFQNITYLRGTRKSMFLTNFDPKLDPHIPKEKLSVCQ